MEKKKELLRYRSVAATDSKPWSYIAGLDKINDVGCYIVELKHGMGNDELPLPDCDQEHYIVGTLIVTESGTENLQKNRIVGQTLILPQCGDGNVAMYSRSYNNLPGEEYKWSHWISTQQNTQVGQVTSLDGFTQGGIYSGVYMSQGSSLETFVLTVIDNDVAATASGKVRSISQFKNSLLVDGTFSYKTRVAQGNGSVTWGNWVDLGAADSTDIQDNSITIQKLSVDVREKVENPLRTLYLAAGAEYNDSGVDKIKTVPWGEIVTHKAGHYYLNGLGDITEEQMVAIYDKHDAVLYFQYGRGLMGYNGRTIFPAQKSGTAVSSFFENNVNGFSMLTNSYNIELFNPYGGSAAGGKDPAQMFKPKSMEQMFYNCGNIKWITTIDARNVLNFTNAFFMCTSLESVYLFGIQKNLSLSDSHLIRKECVRYMIANAVSSTSITIMLHPDAYARFADDTDIVAALEEQPLVSLVSA